MKPPLNSGPRRILAVLLVSGMCVAGCGKETDVPESSVSLWAEISARHHDGTLDVAVFLVSDETAPTTALVLLPLAHEWMVTGAQSGDGCDAAAPVSLAQPHLNKGYQLRTVWHESLDMRPDEGCLAIAVYCPTGAAPLSSGVLCTFSLSPVQPEAAPEHITLELPSAQTPIYINGTPFAVSAATGDAKPIAVSTIPAAMNGNTCLFDIRRWFPILECRRR